MQLRKLITATLITIIATTFIFSPKTEAAAPKVKSGDILVTPVGPVAKLVGHAGIVANDGKSVIHIAGPGYHPRKISLKSWKSRFPKTKIVRYKNASKAKKAAIWADKNFIKGKYKNIKYFISNGPYHFRSTYCSKLVWQAYYKGANVKFKDWYVAGGPYLSVTVFDVPEIIQPYMFLRNGDFNGLKTIGRIN
ncbi:YiiX/YebB-like N1pC/P60 family cysteine hydrolase [Bacillus safensis]|uniref:YiiX/YebB-like N1pC/P60 family cysteine hydrolase n=1 Tax=Bacillus safensis TaxID=561879 RepID=UPI003D3689FD